MSAMISVRCQDCGADFPSTEAQQLSEDPPIRCGYCESERERYGETRGINWYDYI